MEWYGLPSRSPPKISPRSSPLVSFSWLRPIPSTGCTLKGCLVSGWTVIKIDVSPQVSCIQWMFLGIKIGSKLGRIRVSLARIARNPKAPKENETSLLCLFVNNIGWSSLINLPYNASFTWGSLSSTLGGRGYKSSSLWSKSPWNACNQWQIVELYFKPGPRVAAGAQLSWDPTLPCKSTKVALHNICCAWVNCVSPPKLPDIFVISGGDAPCFKRISRWNLPTHQRG